MEPTNPLDQYKCLTKHFFDGFFDLEAIAAPQVEKNVLLVQVFALMILPGAVRSLFLFLKYGWYKWRPIAERDVATLDDKCFFLSLSMILLGLIAAFEWESLFPDQKDYMILTHLPISTRTVFLAKISAIAAFLLAFTVAINLCPTFLFPLGVLARKTSSLQCITYVVSHGISMLLSSIFIFLFAISLQGILLMLFPRKIALLLSPYVRFIFFLLLLSGLFSFPGISSSVNQLIHEGSPIVKFYPPIWFLGIYELLIGFDAPIWWGLALRAIAALTLVGVLTLLTYAVCYGRFMRKSVESDTSASLSPAVFRSRLNSFMDRSVLRKSEDTALFHFVSQTLFRSPRHILYMESFFAVGISIAGAGLVTAAFINNSGIVPHLDKAILSPPLVLSFFLLVAARMGFDVPVDLDANWLFRLAPRPLANPNYAGIRKFLICSMILPLFLSLGILYALIWDWRTIMLHVWYGVILSLLLIELLLLGFAKIPFTCSYLPKAANRVFVWPFYIMGFGLYGYAAASLESWLLADIHRFLCFQAFAVAVLFVLIHYHARWTKPLLRFEEKSQTAPVYLDLRN
jgi:hypothetical protein